jgi:hypothetical protein
MPETDEVTFLLPQDNMPAIPKVWLGFIFPVGFLIGEFVDLSSNTKGLGPIPIVSLIGAIIFWLFCVASFHSVLCSVSNDQYPISPSKAVLYHFVPIYNLYWLYKWPKVMADAINKTGKVKVLRGDVVGLIFLVSLLLRLCDGAIGLAVMFSMGCYLSAKLKSFIRMLGAQDKINESTTPSGAANGT